MSAAIQLSNHTGKHPMKGDTIQYIYTNSQHNNPLCRVVPIDIDSIQEEEKLFSVIMTRKNIET